MAGGPRKGSSATNKNGKVVIAIKGPEHPWEKQPGEGVKPFRAFIIYRDMPNRKLVKVAELLGHVSSMTVDGWSAKWAWADRVIAYDEHLAQVAVRSAEDEYRKMGRRHAKAGQQMADYGDSQITRLFKEGAELDADTARKLIDTGTRLERESRQLEPSDPMAKLKQFEHIVLSAIEEESPAVAERIRARLVDVATEHTGAY